MVAAILSVQLVAAALLLRGAPGLGRHVPVPIRSLRMEMDTAAEVGSLPLKQVKAELDELGVTWRGVCFEKKELVDALVKARTQAENEPAVEVEEAAAEEAEEEEGKEEAAIAEPPEATEEGGYEAAYAESYGRAMKLKAKEIRAELASRQIGWAGLFEKEELASTLAGAWARASLFSKSGALSPGSVGGLTGEQLRSEMQDARTPMLLDVYATWCGPCKMIAPQLEAIAADLGVRARVAKIDSDAEPELSTELGVQGLPTLIFFRPGSDGKLSEAHRLEGVPGSADALRSLVFEQLQVQ